jgi:hypothetical protein
MKIKELLREQEAGDNLDTIVKIDKMPEYTVINPTDEEKEESQDNKKASLPPEVTDNPAEPKEEPKEEPAKEVKTDSDKLDATKNLLAKLLSSIQEFLKEI